MKSSSRHFKISAWVLSSKIKAVLFYDLPKPSLSLGEEEEAGSVLWIFMKSVCYVPNVLNSISLASEFLISWVLQGGSSQPLYWFWALSSVYPEALLYCSGTSCNFSPLGWTKRAYTSSNQMPAKEARIDCLLISCDSLMNSKGTSY